jgi:alkyl hydroperoxide reductase subunit AhpC
MIELGELEARHEDFAKRNTRVVVVSLESQDLAKKTQEDYPDLVVVADADRKLITAVDVLHRDANPHGGDTAAPTTFLIDGEGMVRWVFRPGQVITRLTPDELLAAVDANLPPAK